MTRSPVEARRATVDDLDDLLLLWSQAREVSGRAARPPSSAPVEPLRARLTDALSHGEVIVLIGRYEGVPAGYAVLRRASMLFAENDALHVEQLFVLPSVRRRGMGRALLLVATSIAERLGAEQVLAGAPPSARESHRFLARLGFLPLVNRRVVPTATLRRRLAGETERRGLDDLLSRRRSLRARSLRAGWGRQPPPVPGDDCATAVDGAGTADDTPPSAVPDPAVLDPGAFDPAGRAGGPSVCGEATGAAVDAAAFGEVPVPGSPRGPAEAGAVAVVGSVAGMAAQHGPGGDGAGIELAGVPVSGRRRGRQHA